MTDPAERRRRRRETWQTQVLTEDEALNTEAHDRREHLAMTVAERVALCWTLSRDQYATWGGRRSERRLPRSDLRVARR